MAKSRELFTFSVRRYEEPLWGKRYLGPSRYSLDLGHISFIFEFWWISTKGGLPSC